VTLTLALDEHRASRGAPVDACIAAKQPHCAAIRLLVDRRQLSAAL